jgi:uncharacterized protein YcfJ
LRLQTGARDPRHGILHARPGKVTLDPRRESHMSKSMLVGVVAGVGLATAGGVLGYQFLGQPPVEQGSAVVVDTPAEPVVARVEPAPVPAQLAAPVAQPRPTQPAPRPAAQPRASQPVAAPAPAPAPVEECWDEEVTVTEEPVDQHRIAGTAVGAVAGAAIGNEVSDNDAAKLAGAAAGAFIGRRLQRRMQENREEARTTTTIERRCGPPGSAPR